MVVEWATAGPFTLRLEFKDGTFGTVDLGPRILGRGGMFEPLNDPAYFARVTVDHEAGTIVWPNGVDLDPDVLYARAHGMMVPSTGE
ncbi:MAG: DUF2442 domain-containing protein [Gemmatimonadota bacterium]